MPEVQHLRSAESHIFDYQYIIILRTVSAKSVSTMEKTSFTHADAGQINVNMRHLKEKGYIILDNVFTPQEVALIINKIAKVDSSGPTFRKTNDLFAIRQFMKEIPEIRSLIFTAKLNAIIQEYFGADYFAIKSIYFDKPEGIQGDETICPVKSGGIMIMRPLLLHSSNRTTNSQKRRVIHIEFGNRILPGGLSWAEAL